MFYCGIDVGKRKHAVALLSERGQVHQPVFSIENTQAGLDFLVEALKRLDGEVTVGLEATGHYWLSLFDVLTKNGYRVVVINPLQVAAFRRSGIRKVKNDRSDAVWVADFLRIANLPSTGLTVDPIIDTYDNLPNMLIEQCCTPMNFDNLRKQPGRLSAFSCGPSHRLRLSKFIQEASPDGGGDGHRLPLHRPALGERVGAVSLRFEVV